MIGRDDELISILAGAQSTPQTDHKLWNLLVFRAEAAMGNHPEFALSETRMFGWHNLAVGPLQARNLALVARSRSAVETLAWYRRVLATERTDIRCMALLGGIQISEPIKIGPRVTLSPIDRLPPTRSLRVSAADFVSRWEGQSKPDCVAWTVVSPHYRTAYNQAAVQITQKAHEIVAEVADVLVVEDRAAPVVITEWTEFVDDELGRATTSGSWSRGRSDLRTGGPQVFLTPAGLSLARGYFELPIAFRRKVRLALNRLGAARRRYDPANKAIELAIALEALLSDGNQEMTHKTSTRASVLLGGGFGERESTYTTVKKLYALRSAVVHGSQSRATLADLVPATQIVERLVRLAVLAGGEPDLKLADLMGKSNWLAAKNP